MNTLNYRMARLRGRGAQGYIWGGIALIVLVIIGAVLLMSRDSSTASEESSDDRTEVAQIAVADYLGGTDTVYASGTVRASERLTLRSEVASTVTGVSVYPGARVTPGQTLVVFDDTTANLQYSQALANVNRAQAALTVQETGARSEDLERARLGVVQAEAGLAQAKAQRDQIIVSSEGLLNQVTEQVEGAREQALISARAALSKIEDTLLDVTAFQYTYFICSSDTYCFQIEEKKDTLIRRIYGVIGAGRWNTASVSELTGGLEARLAALESADNIDRAELLEVMDGLYLGLQDARSLVSTTIRSFESVRVPESANQTLSSWVVARSGIDGTMSSFQSVATALAAADRGDVIGDSVAYSDAQIQAQAQIQQAEALVTLQQASVDSAQTAYNALLAGPRDIDLEVARINLEDAQITLQLAANRLNDHRFVSPFYGTVTRMPVRLGDAVNPGQEVVSVIADGAHEVTAFVGVRDSERMRVGDKALIDGIVEGTVIAVSRAADPLTRKVEVRIALSGSEGLYVDDTTVSVEIEVVSADSARYALPISAVKLSSSQAFVLLVNDQNEIVFHPVKTGGLRGSRIEIVDGLTSDMKIIERVAGRWAGELVNVQSSLEE